MITSKTNIRIISLILAVFYISSIICFRLQSVDHHMQRPIFLLALLMAALLMCVLAASCMMEWGRRFTIIFSGISFAVTAVIFAGDSAAVHPGYIFLHIAVMLYYNTIRVRVVYMPPAKLTRKSVLVVDDDDGIVRTIQKTLLNNGYSVLAAQTGEKGLQVAKLQKPDLIILDVILPGIKGREVCQKLKADDETKEIPVIFLTAKDSPDDVKAEMAAGGLTHLTKPVHAKTLLFEIKKILKD